METAVLTQSYRSSHFAPAFFFLSAPRRRALKQLYAVCRALDDAVDQHHPQAREILAAWKECFVHHDPSGLDVFGQGRLTREFLEVLAVYNLPEFALIDLVDKGVALDLSPAKFQTPLETENYCYGVAGTVGILCLPIFGVPWQEAKDFAVRLGITMQWINMIRDVGADAKMGRIYLPLDHLEQFGYTEHDLFALKSTPQFLTLIEYEAKVARGHYARARELCPPRWQKELLPARVMGEIYMRLLNKIEQKKFPVLSHKVTLGSVERVVTACKSLLWLIRT
jgi:phytoene synthase